MLADVKGTDEEALCFPLPLSDITNMKALERTETHIGHVLE